MLAEWDRDTPVGKVLGLVPRALSCGLHAAPCWSPQKWVTLVWNAHSQSLGWGVPNRSGGLQGQNCFIIIIKDLASFSHRCR